MSKYFIQVLGAFAIIHNGDNQNTWSFILNNMTILFLFCLVIFEGNISLNFGLFTLDDNEHASLSAIESDGISCGDQTIM